VSASLAPVHPAIPYLEKLFVEDDHIIFQVIHPSSKDVKVVPAMSMEQATRPETMTRLEELQAQGFNVYVSMNPFPPGTTARQEKFVEQIRNVFIDADADGEKSLQLIRADVTAGMIPAPHSILKTSPNKFHIAWHVDGFTPEEARALNRALANRYGGDPAATDLIRILRMPGFKNLKAKYADKPVCELIEESERDPYSREQFKIETTVLKSNLAPAPPESLAKIIDRIESNAAEASFELGNREADNNGFRWEIKCPWSSSQTTPGDTGLIMLLEDGRPQYNCFHAHCTARGWSDIRQLWQDKVGKRQRFGDAVEELPCSVGGKLVIQPSASVATDVQALMELPDENFEAAIPPFDATVINGIYAKFVELITRGTTLQPQFAYVIAKTIVGLKMAGKVKFDTIDIEPRLYAALIGETGSGKGEAYRRARKIIQPDGGLFDAKTRIKIINSADSGAGLKEFFFSPPEGDPVLCFVDEIEDLGNKAHSTRNPGILDTLITLADDTSITRSLAKGTKTKSDARLAMIMCGQDGLTYTKALAGRTKLGLWDRFYPEHGCAQETGDMPPIDPVEAMKLLVELNAMDYSGTMTMTPESKSLVETFWKDQPVEVRKKARWKKVLQLDAFMSAFGRGVRIVDLADVEIAIKIFTRQLVIRRVCFTTEVPDKIGYYLGLIKRITERMAVQLSRGAPRELVAKTRRDYEKETHAHRDNETHIFARAWQVHEPVWLERVQVKAPNGQTYTKFLPVYEG
jgi:RepB DNA-primase from phage plasmid